MPQVKVASSSEDLGGLTKCPSAPDIAHHKLSDMSSRQQHLSGGGGSGGDSRKPDPFPFEINFPLKLRTKCIGANALSKFGFLCGYFINDQQYRNTCQTTK